MKRETGEREKRSRGINKPTQVLKQIDMRELGIDTAKRRVGDGETLRVQGKHRGKQSR